MLMCCVAVAVAVNRGRAANECLREVAAFVIQRQWRACYYNPSYLLCQRRLMREAAEMEMDLEGVRSGGGGGASVYGNDVYVITVDVRSVVCGGRSLARTLLEQIYNTIDIFLLFEASPMKRNRL